jgi:hypothetical protein
VITIEVKRDLDRYVLVVNGTTVPCRVDSSAKIRELREFLTGALETFATNLLEPPDLATAQRALRSLAGAATTVVDELFGHGRGEGFLIEKVLNARYGLWRVAEKPVVLTIVAKFDEFLPLELLPLFDTSEWPAEGDQPAIWKAIRRFPSFSTIVRRRFPDIDPHATEDSRSLILDNDPRLPFRFFYNDDLDGALQERSFLQEIDNDGIDLAGPWPEQALASEDLPKQLAGHLWEARGRYRRRDQIQHFACHCDSDPNSSLNSRLGFSYGRDVTIAKLKEFLRYRAREADPTGQERSRAARPLVFLNACTSAQVRPGAVTSFPHFFLDPDAGCGDRGVIGTEAHVPDYFAAPFSERFYRYLLSGKKLGEAIYRAKWDLLRGADNPLGILYTVYADPNMSVRIPNPKFAPKGARPRRQKGVDSYGKEAASG